MRHPLRAFVVCTAALLLLLCRSEWTAGPALRVDAAESESGEGPSVGYPTEHQARVIFRVNDTYTWLREQLLRRLPDGSLCCVFFTGGDGDGHARNLVACIRSNDDGRTWSEMEIVASRPDQGCWAPSLFRHKDKAYLFWFTKSTGWRDMTNRLMNTGPDGRTFGNDRKILKGWNPGHIVDVRHGTHLRDGRVLLPIAWQEPLKPGDEWNPGDGAADLRNVGGDIARQRIYYVGVMEPNDNFTKFQRYGRVCKRTPRGPTPSIPFFENAIAELSDERLAMLIRADTTNRLWRTDSVDGGRTWSEPYVTDIPNPGSKPRIINLPDGRIVLFHNPNEKDYSDQTSGRHKYRTPLAMWVSDDGMKTWYLKRTLVAAPKIAQYPDGFYDQASRAIYIAWEDDRAIYFQVILLAELQRARG